jgi:hypothetical protein
VLAARAELDTFPSAHEVIAARDKATRLRHDLAAAENQASERIGQAELALQKALAELDRAADARTAALTAAETAMNRARQAAADAGTKAEAVAAAAAEQSEKARRSEQAREAAATAQRQADSEQAAFPRQQLERVRAAHQTEDQATSDLNRARTVLVRATEQHRLAGEEVRKALRALNQAATLPDGSILPTTEIAITNHKDEVRQLRHLVDLWGRQPSA